MNENSSSESSCSYATWPFANLSGVGTFDGTMEASPIGWEKKTKNQYIQ